MKLSLLIDILRGFSATEIRKFGQFINSPYHNRSKNLSGFYSIISKFHPGYFPEDISHIKIYRLLFPGKKFKVSTIRNLYADLYNAALRFIELENFNREKFTANEYLINELSRKNLVNITEKIIRKGLGSKKNNTDSKNFLNRMHLFSNLYNISYINSRITGNINLKKEVSALDQSVRYLTYYYSSLLSTFFISLKIYEINYNINLQEYFPVKLFNEINPAKILDNMPADSDYHFIFELYTALLNLHNDFGNHKLYKKYKALFEKYSPQLSRDENNMHASNLISFCIHKRDDEGGESYDEELFKLYEMMLEKDYYMSSNTEYLPHELFRSILLEALRTKKFDWAWQFSEVYSSKVRPADRKNMKNLASAYINFETGNFSESLKYLNKINLDFFIFKLDVKNLTLKIFYELGYSEQAFSLIKTYKEYLRKNNLINKEKKARYLSFVKFTEKLLIQKEKCTKSEIGYVKYRIINHKATAFKPWLTEKVMELEREYKISA